MMFCTTFLSNPSEELNCDGGGAAAAAVGGGGLGPCCLSSLHCLVLPQDELYPPLSNPAARLSLCTEERACSFVGKMLLDVNLSPCRSGGGRCIWDRVRRRHSRSASPSQNSHSPCRDDSRGMWDKNEKWFCFTSWFKQFLGNMQGKNTTNCELMRPYWLCFFVVLWFFY